MGQDFKNIEENVVPKLTEDVKQLETSWQDEKKSITNKTNQFISTKNKLQKDMSELGRLQTELENLLKS